MFQRRSRQNVLLPILSTPSSKNPLAETPLFNEIPRVTSVTVTFRKLLTIASLSLSNLFTTSTNSLPNFEEKGGGGGGTFNYFWTPLRFPGRRPKYGQNGQFQPNIYVKVNQNGV